MALIIGKCKWGHDSPINGVKFSPAMLCPLCLIDPDPYIRANAGRVMHPDRYAAWETKKAAR